MSLVTEEPDRVQPGSPAAPARNNADALLAQVREVLPTLRKHAPWAEQHGRLHTEAMAALITAGVPRLYLPESLGGLAVAS